MKKLKVYISLLVVIFLGTECSKETDNYPFLVEDFLSVEKIYSIDISDTTYFDLSQVRAMDVDQDTNLYVLGQYSSAITVFDKSGNFLRKFGRKGQGPNELETPTDLEIHNQKLYILESRKGIKVWDLHGKYVDFLLIPQILNIQNIDVNDNGIVALGFAFTMEQFDLRDWNISRYSFGFQEINRIANVKTYSKKDIKFDYFFYFASDSKNNYYLPESRDKYLIHKYNIQGELISTLQRDFELSPYSAKVKETYFNRLGTRIEQGRSPKLPKYPPYVRRIYVDDYDNVWAIIGEDYQDSDFLYEIDSIVDIFDKSSNFVYTFNTAIFGYPSIIKHNRIYSAPIPTGGDSINVYQVYYKSDTK